MKKFNLPFIFFLILTINVSGQLNYSISDLKIKELDKSYYNFKVDSKTTGTVFIFLLTDCPASQSYTLTINDLVKKYKKIFCHFQSIQVNN